MLKVEHHLAFSNFGRKVPVVAIIHREEAWGAWIELGVQIVRRMQAGYHHVPVFLQTHRGRNDSRVWVTASCGMVPGNRTRNLAGKVNGCIAPVALEVICELL